MFLVDKNYRGVSFEVNPRTETGMRIVYVLTSLGMGGAERQVLELAARMADRGHAVAILILRPPISEQWPTSVPVIHLEMRKNPISMLTGFAQGRRFLREFRPGLVHSHSFHANIVARLLKVLVPSATVLSTVHNVYEGGPSRMIAYRLTDGLARRTTAVSQVAAERFVRLKAVPKRKCVVMTNGIETSGFVADADRRVRMRAEMGVNVEFIWLIAGRIVPAKDFPNLLRAFAQVRKGVPNVQLWVAGEALWAVAHRMRGLARKLDLADAVRWLGLRRDLPALLDAADGFVLASAWEGMPLALGEAMAMEKPVVATDVGGVRELVGDSGVIVPPKDPNALASAMVNVMQRPPEELRTFGRAARDRIRTNFSMNTRADEWEALYRNMAKATA